MRAEPLQERRERLEALIRPGGRIQYSDSLEGTPRELFSAAERFGLEGIVCKRRGSPYRSGASTDWLKVKAFVESELEILGVLRQPGKPTMALMGEIGTRQYVGSAFVTFGRPASDRFWALVEANRGRRRPREGKSKDPVQWLQPGIVGRVRHLRGEKKLVTRKLVRFPVSRHCIMLTDDGLNVGRWQMRVFSQFALRTAQTLALLLLALTLARPVSSQTTAPDDTIQVIAQQQKVISQTYKLERAGEGVMYLETLALLAAYGGWTRYDAATLSEQEDRKP